MTEKFGFLPSGEEATLYTISCGKLTAAITNCGAALVKLLVPDAAGNIADVVLGCEDASGYFPGGCFLGATVGRNANRIKDAAIVVGSKTYCLNANDGNNSLHSGPNGYERRMWNVVRHDDSSICFVLHSPHLDQGFPGNADIQVTYQLTGDSLVISYEAVSDQDTVFNMTNHSYFNLAGHCRPEKAMEQVLSMPARFFTPATAQSIPTGELRAVEGTPMDFRTPKALGRDIGEDYEPLHLQKGYDHNFEVLCNPCAQLSHPESGRSMAVYTDCPGVQVYTANYTTGDGKDGVRYEPRCAVCLETQFYPDAIHNPQWKQPVTKAGEKYKSQTTYRFSW
jgi:aldose 1-epimerase